MESIFKTIESLLAAGYELLFELESEEPSINEIERIFEIRTELIDKLGNEINKMQESKLEPNEQDRERLKNLLTRFQLLDKRINQLLTLLSNYKKEMLGELQNIKKARQKYTASSVQGNNLTRQVLVDLRGE